MPYNTHPMRAALLVGLAAAMSTLGCGGSAPKNVYAYVIQSTPINSRLYAGRIAEIRVASDGTLTPIGLATVGPNYNNYNLGEMLVHPSGKYLLVESGDGNTYELTIESDGTLAENDAATLAGYPVGYTPDGRFVIMGNGDNSTSTVSSYQLASNGIPTLVTTLSSNHVFDSIAVDPSGRYLYATSYDNLLSEYALSPSGVLVFVGSTAMPRCAITISPKEFLYCVEDGDPHGVDVFSIDTSTGGLTPTVSIPYFGGVVFHPSGKYAYGSNGGVTRYDVDEVTGTLVSQGAPIPFTNYFVLDPSGELGLAFTGYDTVSWFSIGNDGQASPGPSIALDPNSLAQGWMAIARR